jgi:hypothetical protein
LAKKGEKYKCEECGLIVVVDDPCGCETVELICCEASMKPVKAVSKANAKPKAEAPKAKPKVKPKAKAKKK